MEGLATFEGEEYYWVVHPLDGTTNYINGLSPYAVSIAVSPTLVEAPLLLWATTL